MYLTKFNFIFSKTKFIRKNLIQNIYKKNSNIQQKPKGINIYFVQGTRKSQPGSLNREKLPLLISLLSSAKSKTSRFAVLFRRF